jgi:lysozyme
MPSIDLLKKMLILDEGKKNRAYKDTEGIWTIGVGRNIEDPGLSDQEVYYLLDNDIQKRLVDGRIEDIVKDLDPVRSCVIVNMSFMGITKLMGFKNMIAAIKDQDFDRAAREMLNSKWAGQVKSRSIRLAYMMKTGTIHEDYT